MKKASSFTLEISNTDKDTSYTNADVTFKLTLSPKIRDVHGQPCSKANNLQLKLIPRKFDSYIKAQQKGIIVYDPLLLASVGRATFYIKTYNYHHIRVLLYKFNAYTDLHKWNQLKVNLFPWKH
jgi:hypothetical protein